MTILAVAEQGACAVKLADELESGGFTVIRYVSLLKVIDNLEALAPHVVIISKDDYPHHWKLLVRCITQAQAPRAVRFFLASSSFDKAVSAEAERLHVSLCTQNRIADVITDIAAIKPEDITAEQQTDSVGDAAEQGVPTINAVLGTRALCAPIRSEQYLLFSHPRTHALVFGIVERISSHDILFYPAQPLFNLHESDVITNASLERDGMIMSVSCSVAKALSPLSIQLYLN